ncbi:MAG: ATP-dependent zinc metalloprotease FtsH [bacterium]|uniref:ATP-dependent zinc metalloprotease FtsH n=1 Tax=Gemmiger sp. TaxID=2049027 RepID=UPI002A91304E|nr:ATP-dependent zinc metalloprotease FtsH [Gemmiger sp.]MDD6718190.1 ATP-dependent zinc metalloprotease FtsH [bacterium]MDY5327069.1 ATP-dependent zinc metalloprotease FtsH [Gemmiger sp.]
MQHKPRFSGIIVAAILLVVALIMISSYSAIFSSSGNTMMMSEAMAYFESNQVTYFNLDLNTGVIEMSLKEGEQPLPENAESAANDTSGGLLAEIYGDSADSYGPKNGGVVTVSYKLPYPQWFIQFYLKDYIDQYNAANPGAHMQYDMVAYKNNVPWFEIILYAFMIGSVVLLFMSMYRGGAGGGGLMNVGRAKVKDQQEGQRKATFADVAGADEEKAELQEVVEFLKAPNKFNALGARIPHGVLLVGPPGTGKTLLARACAGEAGVPFYAISGSDFVEMYVGVGASRVRDLFEKAKKTMPAIIFIDEIDAVGRQRGAGLGGGHDEREQTLNQLLVEMDGFDANDGVIVMAATNRADILDKALLRPGRFDRQVYVGLPDVKGREEILRVHTRNKPLGPDVSLQTIAKSTAGFSGADLENLVNEAALLAARKGKKAITEPEIEEASIKVVAGPEKKSRVVTEAEKRLTAYHEAGHAITGFFCKTHDPVHQISIIPRGAAGGFTMYLPEKDPSYVTKTAMNENIVCLLGGRVAEQLVLDDISTGASNDLERATDTARSMVTRYGFSERMGPVVYGTDPGETFLGRDFGQGKGYSENTAAEIDNEIRDIMDEAYETARRILTEHMDQLHRVAGVLMEKEKISGEEFVKLMQGEALPPFGTDHPAADPQNPPAQA